MDFIVYARGCAAERKELSRGDPVLNPLLTRARARKKLRDMQEPGSRLSLVGRILLGVSGLVITLALGWMAVAGFVRVLPWIKSQTQHVTWIIAGVSFTGWGLLVPPAACLAAAVFALIMSVWVMRTRE